MSNQLIKINSLQRELHSVTEQLNQRDADERQRIFENNDRYG